MELADLVRASAAKARCLAEAYCRFGAGDQLPWKVVESFDADVRGHVERDRQIEDERDRVLIAAVKFADIGVEGETNATDDARREPIDAIDYLEKAALRIGIINRTASKLGYGPAGRRVSTDRQ